MLALGRLLPRVAATFYAQISRRTKELKIDLETVPDWHSKSLVRLHLPGLCISDLGH
jgi:hypothetical protein